MAIDTTPSTVATNALQAIPFSSLIGAPLEAAIQAQAMAAKTSWEFIQNVGLNINPDTGIAEAINVSFSYNRNGQLTQLLVPLLTIVPIPYIAIDTIDINFKANISASSSSVTSTSETSDMSAGGKAKASFGYGPFSVSAEFSANYSSKKDSKASEESKYSVEYTMDVAVHASQSDMPAGLAAILNILQSSITTANSSGTFTIPENLTVTLSDKVTSAEISMPVTIIDQNGLQLPVGTDVSINIPTGMPGLTVTATANTVQSTANGIATFVLKCVAASGYKVPQSVPLTFTVSGYNNGNDLTGTANLEFMGTPIP